MKQERNPTDKRSPLFTSKRRELEKREVIAEKGKDLDGALRVKNRKDAQPDD